MPQKNKTEFPGFDYHNTRKQFLKYPMIMQEYWCVLSGSEQKVIDFIIRQTFGWNKQSDTIAISQFTDGIKKNRGAGVSASQAKRAIDSLEEKGFIEVERRKGCPHRFTMRVSEQAKKNGQAEVEFVNNCYKATIKSTKIAL
jgi:hypothetical protein